ncbi:MAG: adenylate/guanylate cyclase domain-containing protein [Bacteroidota bacterium]|nr:adenylate/guanylate cyclase domain-containing protein [Bacteroidota bacterium]
MFKYAKIYARKEGDSSDLQFQKQLLAIVSGFLFLCGTAWIGLYYIAYGWSMPAYAAAAFAVNALVMIIVSHRLKNHLLLVYFIFYAATISPVIAQWSVGSFHDSGLTIIWGFLTPLGILIFTSLRPAVISFVIFLVCILITAFLEPVFPGPKLVASDNMIRVMYSLNICISFTVIFGTCAWFVHIFKAEKRNADQLLLNILPVDVAEELKSKGHSEAKQYEKVTVLFTDFLGFTQVSEQLSPEELVNDLNLCFSTFDEITQKHGIEKIKTIGDAYMAAGGLPTPNSTNAKDVVLAALEICNFIEEGKAQKIANNKPYFEVRVGVNTGPLVAGIIGIKKFQYDIWGDTVNTAARLETSCMPGKVNISQSTYELLKDDPDFVFEHRGKINAKGKGEVEMWFVKFNTSNRNI